MADFFETEQRLGLAQTHYEYEYPNGLDLNPNTSSLHNRLKDMVLSCAKDSHAKFATRRQSWADLDLMLTAYISLSDAERKIRVKDDRKPVSIIVPTTYATLTTLLTYMTSAFMRTPEVFKYDNQAPEDLLGTIMLEKIIERQSRQFKHGLSLHTQWRDSFVYGMGAITPIWTVRRGRKTSFVPKGFNQGGVSQVTGYERQEVEDVVLAEGNDLQNISAYNFLPDPSVSIHRIQDGEYVGWVVRASMQYWRQLEEQEGSGFFNVKYLRHVSGASSLYDDRADARDKYNVRSGTGRTTGADNKDVIFLYKTLVPKDYGLGSSDRSEKWLLAVGGDSILLAAMPVTLDHGQYPIAVAAPEFDGYNICNPSTLEIIGGLQTAVDYLYNTHIEAVRKNILNQFIIDPYLVNVADFEKGDGLIRMKRSAWGRGVENALKQLQVTDITRQNIGDISAIMDIMQRVSGTSDMVQGVVQPRGERISATEIQSAHGGALSRLEHMAKVIWMQSHQDLGLMVASQTKQLISQEYYAKINGRWSDTLQEQFQLDIKEGRLHITPDKLDVNVDMYVEDMGVPGTEFAEVWSRIFQTVGSSQELTAQLDTVKIFKFLATMAGAKNIEDFARRTPVQAQMMGPEQLQAQVQQGNMVSVEQAAAATQGGYQ